MRYTLLQCEPKDLETKLNALAAQGWRVVSQSETTWSSSKCFGLFESVDSVINVILVKQ